MLRILEKLGNKRPIHIITRSSYQYLIFTLSIEIKPIDKNKGSVVIFGDMLGARKSSQIGEFFTRGKHENLVVCYISQSYFGLPRQSLRNDTDRIILFKQTLRDVDSKYNDIGGYDTKYDEFKGMCRKTGSEETNYLCIDMTKTEKEGKYRKLNESKNKSIEGTPKSDAFSFLNVVPN